MGTCFTQKPHIKKVQKNAVPENKYYQNRSIYLKPKFYTE